MVVKADAECPTTESHSWLKTDAGTVHDVTRCTRHAHGAKLYWRTPTSTVEVAALRSREAEQGNLTSVIYVDGTHKTPLHYEEFEGKLSGTEMSDMVGPGDGVKTHYLRRCLCPNEQAA